MARDFKTIPTVDGAPLGYRNHTHQEYIKAADVSPALVIAEKAASDPIGTYPMGESVFLKSDSAVGYPQTIHGTVRTSKTSTTTCHQTFYPNDISNFKRYERYWEPGFIDWTAWSQHIHDDATATVPGFMPAADKKKLDGMPAYSYLEKTRSINLPVAHNTVVDVPFGGTAKHIGNDFTVVNNEDNRIETSGVYLIVFSGRWVGNNTGNRLHEIVVSNVAVNDQDRRTAASSSGFSCSVLAYVPAGGVFYARVHQTSTVTLELLAANLTLSAWRLM